MRRLSYSQFGEPAKVIGMTEAPSPQPGKGEVLVAMILSPIHNHDVITVRGNYGHKPALPAIGGSEGVGTIAALGEGVSGLEIGQRVAVSGLKGAWAEEAVARAASVVPLPAEIDDETAAQLIAMPLSALTLLDFTGIQPGQWLIQNAANGAVAKALAQLAGPRGIQVVNLVRRAEAVSELEALGIGSVVATDTGDWKAAVTRLTGGAPIAVGIDGVGGDASGDLLSLLGEGGQLVSFGAMSGEAMRLSGSDLIFKQAIVKGFWLSKLMETMAPADLRRLIGELVSRAASGALKLETDRVFPMEAAADAMRAAEASGRRGKILLRLKA
ncbi:zinc-binding dehydrogenase [Rhizobium sp. SSA_523]|uniref:zinc-binding dehydrogenase n=1 Tax=Rhizobium sp. SSA_523 TaxID=2952477 RepID=UPI002090CD4C|nr:zinc-binding dehydrogenase [Rhizobium sp. SSA_523]MCO5731850.1 zinc-binding dehydrogenase [Rhizobium sp. SSA_523]WKC22788.1 zinc-binding dehydrogenase [Rhizobium sp. SSA_523]